MSNCVKVLTKQHFSCFYIKLEPFGDFCQLWPSLTKLDLTLTPRGTKNPCFLSINWNKLGLVLLQRLLNSLSNDYSWVEIGVKTVEISRKPCKAHHHSSWGDNFWSNRLIVNFFCALETRHLRISRDTKISLIQFLEKCNQSQHRKASQLGWVGASCRVTNPTQCTYKVCQASGHVPRSPEPSFCIKKELKKKKTLLTPILGSFCAVSLSNFSPKHFKTHPNTSKHPPNTLDSHLSTTILKVVFLHLIFLD